MTETEKQACETEIISLSRSYAEIIDRICAGDNSLMQEKEGLLTTVIGKLNILGYNYPTRDRAEIFMFCCLSA